MEHPSSEREPPTSEMREPPELPAKPQREDLPSPTAEPEDQPSLPHSTENLRRSTHQRSTPERLITTKLGFTAFSEVDYVPDTGATLHSYFKQEPSYLILCFIAQVPYLNLNLAHPIAFRATGKVKDPDLFSYNEAM